KVTALCHRNGSAKAWRPRAPQMNATVQPPGPPPATLNPEKPKRRPRSVATPGPACLPTAPEVPPGADTGCSLTRHRRCTRDCDRDGPRQETRGGRTAGPTGHLG